MRSRPAARPSPPDRAQGFRACARRRWCERTSSGASARPNAPGPGARAGRWAARTAWPGPGAGSAHPRADRGPRGPASRPGGLLPRGRRPVPLSRGRFPRLVLAGGAGRAPRREPVPGAGCARARRPPRVRVPAARRRRSGAVRPASGDRGDAARRRVRGRSPGGHPLGARGAGLALLRSLPGVAGRAGLAADRRALRAAGAGHRHRLEAARAWLGHARPASPGRSRRSSSSGRCSSGSHSSEACAAASWQRARPWLSWPPPG